MEKFKKTNVWIIIVIIVVLLCCGCYLLLGNKIFTKKSTNNSTTTTTKKAYINNNLLDDINIFLSKLNNQILNKYKLKLKASEISYSDESFSEVLITCYYGDRSVSSFNVSIPENNVEKSVLSGDVVKVSEISDIANSNKYYLVSFYNSDNLTGWNYQFYTTDFYETGRLSIANNTTFLMKNSSEKYLLNEKNFEIKNNKIYTLDCDKEGVYEYETYFKNGEFVEKVIHKYSFDKVDVGHEMCTNSNYEDLLLVDGKLNLNSLKIEINDNSAIFSLSNTNEPVTYNNVKKVYIFTYPEGSERWIYIVNNNGEVFKSEEFDVEDLDVKKLSILINGMKKMKYSSKIDSLKEVYTGEDEVGAHFGVIGIDSEGNIIP